MGAVERRFPTYTEADWRAAVEKALKGANVDSLSSETADGIRIEPLYQPAEGARAPRESGPWRVIARLDNPDPAEANPQARDDLAGGADGLQVVFSGGLGAYGHGLERFDAATLHRAFEAIRFDAGSRFELDLGRHGPDQARGFAALIDRSGARPADCDVFFGLDPFAVCAQAIFPADWAAHASPYFDTAHALRASGFGGPLLVADARAVHAAGGTAGQELAFAFAAGVCLMRSLKKRGVSLDEARARIAFRLAADADEFTTLSKFRALRVAWARIEEACGLEPRSIRILAETAWRMMTARDPYVNVMRGAMAALSAGLGGADSVAVLPHTLAVGLPDRLARRLARNGQLILLRESNLGFVVDPAAGAGAFEALTEALCAKSWALFQEIEGRGGLPAALASGAFQRRVATSAAALKRSVATLKSPITGVSAHADLAEPPAEVAQGAFARDPLAAVEGAFAPMRLAEPFEDLRAASDAMLRNTGSRPKVYLVALGAEPSHRGRVAFAREWLEMGGIEPVYDGEAATPERAIERFDAAGASLACLCGADETYATMAERYATAIKASGSRGLLLAGRPGKEEARLRAAGIDDFIFAGADALASLRDIYRRLAAQA